MSVYLLVLLHMAPASYSVYHILLFKRDTRAALGWIMACLFIPFGGPLAYFFFGINRVRSHASNLKRRLLKIVYEAGTPRLRHKESVEKGLRAVGYYVTGTALSAGNSIEFFHNGEQAYPAMLDSIKKARKRILLTTYILKTDLTGETFINALSDAIQRGVEVKVLVDGIGEFYSWPKPSKILKKRNVPVAKFMPPRLLPPNIYLNMRNHRKMLVIDDELAFAGGMNISDDNLSFPENPRKVTDVHFSFRGAIVSDLAKAFYHDWLLATGERATIETLPDVNHSGESFCRVIPDGPDEAMDFLALTILGVIGAATECVDIMTPYFVPNREMISSLQSAALRGVKIRIVLPEKNNLVYMQWANRNALDELLQLNIEVFYQPAPFCHSKLLRIDHEYCMIGSANLDPRSLRLNYEVGIEIFSEKINASIKSHFEEVISASTRLNLVDLENRTIPVRLRDSIMSLLSPYL